MTEIFSGTIPLKHLKELRTQISGTIPLRHLKELQTQLLYIQNAVIILCLGYDSPQKYNVQKLVLSE